MFRKGKKIFVQIEGMSCQHCAKKVEETLLSILNVKSVKVNLEKKTAAITTMGAVDKNEIKMKIENLDYIVKEIEEV